MVARMDETPKHREGAGRAAPLQFRGRLFRKYVGLFLAVISLALIPKGLLDIWFSYAELRPLLVRIQSEQARAAADKIGHFIKEIEGQMAWATQLPLLSKSENEWRLDATRLLRQIPALTEIAQFDGQGRERYRMSRQAMDVIGSLRDYSQDPAFVEAMANKAYYGPVFFINQSEPYMTIGVGGAQRDFGVILGQVNLKFIWDVISQIKVGERGLAYVVDTQGRLIAHPDISLVLRNIDLSRLSQVRTALIAAPDNADHAYVAKDINDRDVLSTYAPVPPTGWRVFTEMPTGEAFAPLYETILRSVVLLGAGLTLAFCAGVFLARRLVVPIRALSDGAERIGSGNLSQRLGIRTGDELQELGEQFNAMAERLQDSHATLERKVDERTRQLEAANLAKSRFMAAASHDLRQPLHALGLFVAQLHGKVRTHERKQIMARVDAALSAMNELFNALLDISRLDAGVMKPAISDFPVAQLLRYIETAFAETAREKGISLRIMPCAAWIRSDFILLERVVFNLVSNALRYTKRGKVLVGCRKKGAILTIEVWDTGPGIRADQRVDIFSEFYRIAETANESRGGLGLGLAIVDRLCRLLGHGVNLASAVGKGSCFSVSVPAVPPGEHAARPPATLRKRLDFSVGKLVVVVDNDPLVLDGMTGLFKSWGCEVITANSNDAVLAAVARLKGKPDLIISDYHLAAGKTGIEVIEAVREAVSARVPAFLISGDTDPKSVRNAAAQGFHLLHKPVEPMALRAMFDLTLRGVERAKLH